MQNFKEELKKKFYKSIYNNYGKENYDENSLGSFPKKFEQSKFNKINVKNKIKRIINFKDKNTEEYFEAKYEIIKNDEQKFIKFWNKLNKIDKNLIIDLLVYHFLGFQKVKLDINNEKYWNTIKKAKTLQKSKESINSNFRNFILNKYNLKEIGYNVEFFFNTIGIATDFILEQYAYKINGETIVSAEKGDTVLDIGGCWGDTALYFADKVDKNGKVFSFEFIPGNINIHNKNTALNPHYKSVINLIEHPVLDKSDVDIYYKDNGPGSLVELKPFKEQTGTVKTLSIDDFVDRYNVNKVDFIKMDIEGAEPLALTGAIKTIKKFKPKLAIAMYHGLSDFVNIPNWILDLNLGYEIFIGHYTIHAEETVCFALPKDRN